MEYKFLSDGRKVAVVGQINSTEYVVQEIFITADGDEIPSGEKFTTKSLHEKPVESYHVRQERLLKGRITSLESKEVEISKRIQEKEYLLKARADMLANSPELKDIVGGDTAMLSMFITGTIEYVVRDSYRIEAPVPMKDIAIYWDDWYGKKYNGLKLFSVFGDSQGNIDYRINQYNDGSGSWEKIYVFRTYDEALNKIKERAIEKINEGHFSETDKNTCSKLGIIFDTDTLHKILGILSEDIKKKIVDSQKRISEGQKAEEELNMKLEELAAGILG